MRLDSANIENGLETSLTAIRRLAVDMRGKLLKWKKEGLHSLAEAISILSGDGHDKEKKKSIGNIWVDPKDEPSDLILYSLVRLILARDLSESLSQTDKQEFLKYVKKVEDEINNTDTRNLYKFLLSGNGLPGRKCIVPMLQCARMIQASFSSPLDCALRKGTLICNFAILKELFTVGPPGWAMGSARACKSSLPTAFITGECTRARGYLIRALYLSSTHLRLILNLLKDIRKIHDLMIAPPQWRSKEIRRLRDSYSQQFAVNSRRSILAFTMPEFDSALPSPEGVILQELEKNVSLVIKTWSDLQQTDVDHCLKLEWPNSSLWESLSRTPDFNNIDLDFAQREVQIQESVTFELALLQTNKNISLLLNALRDLREAVQKFGSVSDELEKVSDRIKPVLSKLEEAATAFDVVAGDAKRINEPSEQYFKSVLERELAAKETQTFNLGELVFAASSLSELEPFDYQREIAYACEVAIDKIARDGIISRVDAPMIASFGHSEAVFVLGTEIIRSFTQLVANVGAEINDQVVAKLIEYFETIAYPDPLPKSNKFADVGVVGWHHDFPSYPLRTNRYTTAIALLALDKVCRMIDSHVNRSILRHFRVLYPESISVSLNDLVYPDYGLSSLSEEDVLEAYIGNPESCGKSISDYLQAMQSHLMGIPLASKDIRKCTSMIMFGPPGTGKSTLPRALAKSSKVPFVEITPGDLLAKGESMFDYRTSSVFEAVSYLRNCVVLFDEFDQMLLKREPGDKNENIFSFATGNNLTRLADLRGRFESGRSVFILSTNRISKLDNAAIRKGRFDAKIGIYSPDFISMAGVIAKKVSESTSFDADSLFERYASLLRELHSEWGYSMPALNSKGNFGKWKDEEIPGTFQAFMNSRVTLSSELSLAEKDVTSYLEPESEDSIAKSEWMQIAILRKMRDAVVNDFDGYISSVRANKPFDFEIDASVKELRLVFSFVTSHPISGNKSKDKVSTRKDAGGRMRRR
ncbi:MAG: AAA family ATPase [Pirellula sp.]|jgi:ABC-type iron transport system FetAB ATPase subunit